MFDIRFSQVPDFFTLDEFNRQRHSFQHYVSVPSFSAFLGSDLDFPLLIVRGEEVHLNNTLVVRRVDPPSCGIDPACGGWGEAVTGVPLLQEGRRATFRVPLSAFDRSDGYQDYLGTLAFAVHYFLESFEFGAWSAVETLQGIARVATVQAGIAPSDSLSRINPKSDEVVTMDVVSFGGTEDEAKPFFAELIDRTTLELGPDRARPLHVRLVDLNGDGLKDLRATFTSRDLGVQCIDNEIVLTGTAPDFSIRHDSRATFAGRQKIRIEGCAE